eukprot:Clim_evm44s88 gene=Clim_evmTU44s88
MPPGVEQIRRPELLWVEQYEASVASMEHGLLEYSHLMQIPTDEQTAGDLEETPLLRSSVDECGRCNNAQTTYNACNVLMGAGILSLPFAMKLSGWVAGVALFLSLSMLTNYTAKLLAVCLAEGRQRGIPAQSYPDLGEAVAGKLGRHGLGTVFFLDLVCSGVMFVILFADSMVGLIPSLPRTATILGFCTVMTPVLWTANMRRLSFTSFLGMASCIAVLVALLLVGTVDDKFKNLVQNTSWSPPHGAPGILLSYGIVMMAYCGHATYPSILGAMKTPKHAKFVVNASYAIVVLVYFGMALLGYVMFGEDTAKEITLNFPRGLISMAALTMVTINTAMKYPLIVDPAATYVEAIAMSMHPQLAESGKGKKHKPPLWLRAMVRTFLVALTAVVSITVSDFARVLSFMGAVFASLLALIFPFYCYLKIIGPQLSVWSRTAHWILFWGSIGLSVAGVYGSISMD